MEKEVAEEESFVIDPAAYHYTAMELSSAPDQALAAYRDETLRPQVTAFFAGLTGNEAIAGHILEYASKYDISPALAFALCWEESRYNPWACNRLNANNSLDRGLFQLNSLAFPKLSGDDAYDPETNARYALSFLRYCIDKGGSETAGLAMYNAGPNRVNQGGTPKKTLNYIARISAYRNGIEELFRSVMGLAA
jgi:soluble lytic murein transglycosylase-like protein